MTPDTVAVSIWERLGLIPSESDAAIIIRHAEREGIPAGAFGEFESLSSSQAMEQRLSPSSSVGPRLMRALLELGLVWRDDTDVWRSTDRGAYLRRSPPQSLADAVDFGAHVSRLDAGGGSGAPAANSPPPLWISPMPSPSSRKNFRAVACLFRRISLVRAREVCGRYEHGCGVGLNPRRLDWIPPESDAAIIIRHAEREGIPAGEFGEFESLSLAQEVEQCLSLPPSVGPRLMRDLLELRLVWRDDTDAWRPTDRGAYLIELVLDESSGVGGLLDLHMLAVTQGAERTAGQFRELLSQTGFELLDVTATGSVSSVVRARAV